MSDRLRELLIKSVRLLPQEEQDEVLGELLAAGGSPWIACAYLVGTSVISVVATSSPVSDVLPEVPCCCCILPSKRASV